MNKRIQVIGSDLKVGDVILCWVNGDGGMLVEHLAPYNGIYKDDIVNVASLKGIKHSHYKGLPTQRDVTTPMSISKGSYYTVLARGVKSYLDIEKVTQLQQTQ